MTFGGSAIRKVYALLALVLLSSFGTLYAQSPGSEWSEKMERSGLVDIKTLIPDIVVSLMYSSVDNFMGEDVYGDLETAYVEPSFGARLKRAQELLHREKGARYSIIIYDAARPLSIQKRMWQVVKNTPNRKYVAPPSNGGGRHNYGLAADLSIIDTRNGKALDMGSPVDHFGVRAHIGDEDNLVKKRLISPEARANRAYLFSLMKRVGLRPIRKEWWHFQEYTSIQSVRKHTFLNF